MITAIEELKKMSMKHPDPGFWAHNIITANTLCKTDLEHKHFWCYLSNPEAYNPDLVAGTRTLGDRIDELSEVELANKIVVPALPECMEEIIHRNGNHILIEHKLKSEYKEAQRLDDENYEDNETDDEKIPPKNVCSIE